MYDDSAAQTFDVVILEDVQNLCKSEVNHLFRKPRLYVCQDDLP